MPQRPQHRRWRNQHQLLKLALVASFIQHRTNIPREGMLLLVADIRRFDCTAAFGGTFRQSAGTVGVDVPVVQAAFGKGEFGDERERLDAVNQALSGEN